MSFLKDKVQLRSDVVEGLPEFDFVIALNNGALTRHDPIDIYCHQDHIHVRGPSRGEWTQYPMTSIAFYGKEKKTTNKEDTT